MPSHAERGEPRIDVAELPGVDAGLQDRLDPALVLAPAHPELLGPLVGERRELVEEHPHVVGVAVDDVEQLVAEHRQLLGRRPARCGDPVGAEHHLVHHPVVDRGEQLLLRPDVVVEGALAEAVDLAQLHDAGGVVAAPGEHRRRRVDDRVATRLPLRAAFGFVARCRSAASAATVPRRTRPSAALPLRPGASRRRRPAPRSRPPTRAARPAAPRPAPQRVVALAAAAASRTTRRLARTASGAAATICPATRSASSSAAPGSTSRLTSPRSNARRASIGSPVRIASIAGPRPIARGSRNSPPAAAIRLRRTSASPNADRVVATTTSAARTISRPPAVARPSTATTIGFVRSRYTNPREPAALGVERRRRTGLPDDLEVGARAEDRAPWSPVLAHSTPTQTSGSSSSRSTAASSPSAISRSTALRASGRLSVMTPMRSADEYRTADKARSRVEARVAKV